MSQKRKSSFLKNQDATAEIIGTVLAIIILIFFFGNVFLWSNEVNKISDQIKWDKQNSPIRIEAIYEVDLPNVGNNKIFSHFEVTNQGGVDASLSRLWILNSSNTGDANDHIFADLEPLNVWVSAGNKKVIKLNTTTITHVDGSLAATIRDSEIIIFYEPPQGFPITFKILTTTGNTAACSIGTIGTSYSMPVSGFDYVSSEYVLPWTGLGADYLLYYSNADVSVWLNTEFTRDGKWYHGHIDLVNYWKPLFHTSKIGFTFPGEIQSGSYYEYDKMNEVIQLFANRNSSVIPAFYPAWNAIDIAGSPRLITYWENMTRDFLGDDRIAAFNVYGEVVGHVDGGQGTDSRLSWHPDMENDREKMALYFVELTEAIHAIDPNRIVVYPYLGLSYDGLLDQKELMTVLEPTGILDNPNVIFDIVHPYYFGIPEWDEGDPAQKPWDYKTQFIDPWLERVPSNRLWCGETFMFNSKGGQNELQGNEPILEEQNAFMVNMINVFVETKVGFNLWASLAYPPDYTASFQQYPLANAHITAIKASNYGLTIIEPQ